MLADMTFNFRQARAASMHCEDVFDLLTAATEGDGVSAAAVESHLAGCSACRELAAALRPATALLRTSALVGEHHSGPASPAAAPWLSETCAVPAASRGSWLKRRWSKRNWQQAAWPLAAAVLLGIAVGGAAQRWLQGGWFSGPPSLAQQEDGGWELIFRSEGFEGQIRLASDCLGEDAAPHVRQVALADLDCCTNCHRARAAALPALAVAQVASSCRLCHNP